MIKKHYLAAAIIILLFVLIRMVFLRLGGSAIDADEAIVGLMARHILEGRHVAFYYGQDYMGSLEAYLAAAVFAVFGSSPIALKSVPFIASIGFLLATMHLASALYGRKTGYIAGVLLISPPFFS